MKQTFQDLMAPRTRPQPAQNKDFTDRKTYLAFCEEQFDKPQTTDGNVADAYRVLVLWGVAGQGKSEILWEFFHRIKTRGKENGRDPAVGIVDFNGPEYRDPVGALLKLRSDLKGQGISFETFDTAFVRLYELQHPGRDLHEAYDALDEHGGTSIILELVEYVAGDVPGAGFLFNYGRKMLTPLMRNRWLSNEIKQKANEIVATPSPERLVQRLPEYFGSDLRRSMQRDDVSRVAIAFDHYQALGASGGAVVTQTDRWLRSLIKASPGALILIFGRNKLDWCKDDSFFKPTTLIQKPTYGLHPEDARRYLEYKGLTDDAICTRIVDGAHGVPLHLALAARLYHDLVADGRAPAVEDFGRTPMELVDQFIDHLSDSERSNLRIASYPDAIDESLYFGLVHQFPGHVSNADWAQLTGQSFMFRSSGFYTMHPTIRDELQLRECERSNMLYSRVHRFLFDYYRQQAGRHGIARQLGSADDRAFVAAARHLARSEPAYFPTWLLDHDRKGQTQLFGDGDRWRALLQVFEIAASAGRDIYSDEDRLWLGHHQAHVLQMAGCFEDAAALYENALEAHESIVSDPSPEQALERATIVHALGDVYRQLDPDDSRSETCYRRALGTYDAVPQGFEQRRVDVEFSLGLLRDAAGDATAAKRLYDDAKRRNAALHGDGGAPYAMFLTQLGQAHRTYGRNEDALAEFAQARAILSGDGTPDDGVGIVLLEIAECRAATGNESGAAASFDQAVAALEAHAGDEHANTAHARHRQARFWLRDRSRLDAARAQIERAVSTLEATMGSQHEWTREARADLNAAA
ncbi:MAG: tetratricopeptide repeat protein [Gammaproteobacteria bacterium]|nr:tetratricopeptide repeat protein [Gammaproteobacteria bacterium]